MATWNVGDRAVFRHRHGVKRHDPLEGLVVEVLEVRTAGPYRVCPVGMTTDGWAMPDELYPLGDAHPDTDDDLERARYVAAHPPAVDLGVSDTRALDDIRELVDGSGTEYVAVRDLDDILKRVGRP